MGKEAERYFDARCAFNMAPCEEGIAGRNIRTWQKISNSAIPDETELFIHEFYPVLVTEYKLNGKSQSRRAETELIMINVTADVM